MAEVRRKTPDMQREFVCVWGGVWWFVLTCDGVWVCRVLLHVQHAAVQRRLQLLQFGRRRGDSEQTLRHQRGAAHPAEGTGLTMCCVRLMCRNNFAPSHDDLVYGLLSFLIRLAELEEILIIVGKS